MQNIENYRTDDPCPDVPLQDIEALPTRIEALLARNRDKPLLKTGFVNVVGAIEMLRGLCIIMINLPVSTTERRTDGFSPLIYANRIASHRILSEYLYPEIPWHLGSKETYTYRDAYVRLTHIGNRTGLSEQARSYRYRVQGEGFAAAILVIWNGGTASVSIENVTDPLAYNCWLRGRDLEDGYAMAKAASSLVAWYRFAASSEFRRELVDV